MTFMMIAPYLVYGERTKKTYKIGHVGEKLGWLTPISTGREIDFEFVDGEEDE